MKLIIKKEDKTREFYDELLYIASKYPKIVKKPTSKVHKSTITFGIYNLLALVFLILFFLLYLKIRGILLLIVFIDMILMFLLSLYYYIGSYKFINKELNDNDDSELTINEIGIRLVRGEKLNYMLKYDDIAFIIINKYTISVLPKTKQLLIISAYVKYKNEIIKELKKLKKDKLIVDNTELYK